MEVRKRGVRVRMLQSSIEQLATDGPPITAGPASAAVHPHEYADAALAHVPEETARKVLHDNAAALYGLD